MKVVVSSSGAGADNALPGVVDGGVLVGVDGQWVGATDADIQVNSIEAAGQAASGSVATGALSAESGDLARATDILPESATVADADAYGGDGGATGHDATGFYSVKGAETKRLEHDTIAALGGLISVLDGKIDQNEAIEPATKTKITYDAKGLVTGGADATTADIADSEDKRYCTDAEKTKLAGIAAGAEVNVNADWDAVSGDSLILNKPATMPPSVHDQAASTVSVATTNFDGVLTAAEDTVQKALDALDDHSHAGSTGVLYGPQGSRPAAGAEGRLYMPTDGYFQQ